MDFKRPEQYEEWLKSYREAASASRNQLARNIGICQCYYIGKQWINDDILFPATTNSTTGRLLTSWNPDKNELRSSINRVTSNVIQASAATFPEEIYFDVFPPDGDAGLDAQAKADTVRHFTNWSVDQAGFLNAARDANIMRCIAGTWGLGFFIDHKMLAYEGREEPDQCVRAFSFDPVRLVLDPAQTSRDLCDHDTVTYEDSWTLEKVERVFGIVLESKENYPTIGTLMSQELAVNTLSQNQLYQQYRTYSTTRGTIVSLTWMRDATGYFRTMYASYRNHKGEFKTQNFDNPMSPFGGNGLPLGLLHGHRRPGSPWSIGEAGMLKQDQDRLNLLITLYHRILRKYSWQRVVVDRRNFDQKVSEDEIAGKFTNIANGVVVTSMRTEKGIPPPQYIQDAPPPSFIMNDTALMSQDMQRQVFRAPGHYGELKTHTPDAAVARTMEAADQVLAIRVKEDVATYEKLTRTLVSTNMRLFKAGNPGTLAGLVGNGMGEFEFQILLSVDDDADVQRIKLKENTVRFRSRRDRELGLERAVQAQAVTAMQYRTQMASLDLAVIDTDEKMQTELVKAVDRCIQGEVWEPLLLGSYQEPCLDLLRQAQFEKRCLADPQAKARIVDALIKQTQAVGMEQALMAPPVPPGEEQETQTEPPQPATLGDVLTQMQGQGAQPVAA